MRPRSRIECSILCVRRRQGKECLLEPRYKPEKEKAKFRIFGIDYSGLLVYTARYGNNEVGTGLFYYRLVRFQHQGPIYDKYK